MEELHITLLIENGCSEGSQQEEDADTQVEPVETEVEAEDAAKPEEAEEDEKNR